MLHFKPETTLQATRLDLGDKYDLSVVHLLSTLPSESFLVEKKGEAWTVTTGNVEYDTDLVGVPVVDEPVAEKKPEKKKKK